MLAAMHPYMATAQGEVQRVSAARHSGLYANVFSEASSGTAVINSVPISDRNPSRSWICCTCCNPTLPTGAVPSPVVDATLRETKEVDVQNQTLLVSSGYTFRECTKELEAAGLVLLGTPEADTITIGGAIAVGAHGGGRKFMPLSGYLLEIWLRDGRGQIKHISKGDPDFAAAAVSLGLLGVIVKVKLQCMRPEKNIKFTASSVGSYGAEGLNSVSADTHSFQFAPYQQRMIRFDETETDESVWCCGSNCCGCLNTSARQIVALPCVTSIVDSILPCCPALACILSQSTVCPGTCVYNKFTTFLPTPANFAYTVEYAFDVNLAGQVFEKLKAVVAENAKEGRYVTYRFWCRFIGSVDSSWALAQSAGANKVAFEFTFSQKQKGVLQFLDAIVAVFQEFRGRPHMGKTIRSKDVAYAAEIYGSAFRGQPFLAFDEARRRYDPDGVYLNAELAKFVAAATVAAQNAR